jgi:hypothetical protein
MKCSHLESVLYISLAPCGPSRRRGNRDRGRRAVTHWRLSLSPASESTPGPTPGVSTSTRTTFKSQAALATSPIETRAGPGRRVTVAGPLDSETANLISWSDSESSLRPRPRSELGESLENRSSQPDSDIPARAAATGRGPAAPARPALPPPARSESHGTASPPPPAETRRPGPANSGRRILTWSYCWARTP